MPIKDLTFTQHDRIYDIIDGDWTDYESVIDKLNHEFAKIYGYSNRRGTRLRGNPHRKPKRALSAWQKFVKANSKKPRFVLRSGKLNLKKMGVAYRKTPAGKKSKRR